MIRLKDDVADDGKEIVEKIHRYHPSYIFLTETSSVQVGYLIKEALKVAYPNEPLPRFYRIDPRQVIPVLKYGQDVVDGKVKRVDRTLNAKKEELEEFFRKRIKNKKARILVYDRDWSTGKSPGSVLALLKNPSRFGFSEDIACQNVKMNMGEGNNKGEDFRPEYWQGLGLDLALTRKDILPIQGYGGFPYEDMKVSDKNHSLHPNDKSHPQAGNYNFRGSVRKSLPEHQKGWFANQKEFIKDVKRQGKTLGRVIHKELEKRRSLERRVTSVIVIGSLAISILFFSSNITGNVIANLPKTSSNWIGAVLFFIVLIGVFYYFKSRRTNKMVRVK